MAHLHLPLGRPLSPYAGAAVSEDVMLPRDPAHHSCAGLSFVGWRRFCAPHTSQARLPSQGLCGPTNRHVLERLGGVAVTDDKGPSLMCEGHRNRAEHVEGGQ